MGKKPRSNRGKGRGLQFLSKALISDTDDCIEWPFYRMKNGYAQVGMHHGTMLAHRYVCTKAHGPAEKGMQAAHRCGNRACVNPRHVRWATQSENEADKLDHGTWLTRMGGAKLNEDRVRQIRSMSSLGMSSRQISDEVGTPLSTIEKVVRRETWRHVA